jgi:hypothetical protein
MYDLAQQMRSAARAFLDSLTRAQQATVLGTFDVDELTSWTYLPGGRPGIAVSQLDSEQRNLASALLRASLSERGAGDAENVVRLEAIARSFDPDPHASSVLTMYADPRYWLRILGEPEAVGTWAWRLSGHHLVAQATVVGDVVSTTPQFFGAQPAIVASGPHIGFRPLAAEEDLARTLLDLLDDAQRRSAVISAHAPSDIKTRYDPVATVAARPPGLPQEKMGHEQQELFTALIRQYLDRAPAPVSNRAWSDLTQAGLGSVTFAWAGTTTRTAGHYYAVTGQTFLLEYDNTQDNANHIHSVWRDLRHDWAGDLLANHYRTHLHPH